MKILDSLTCGIDISNKSIGSITEEIKKSRKNRAKIISNKTCKTNIKIVSAETNHCPEQPFRPKQKNLKSKEDKRGEDENISQCISPILSGSMKGKLSNVL